MKLRSLLWQMKRAACCGLVVGAAFFQVSALAAGVKIEFLPPPMEGTISLGIYDQGGKLVRVLHREAELNEFKIALNGLVTEWDGTDDAGAPCPAGTYRARGYRVGDVKLEGIEIHGNDWVTEDDSPRIQRIIKIEPRLGGEKGFVIEAIAPGSTEPKRFLAAPKPDEPAEWGLTPEPAALEDSKAIPAPSIVWTLKESGEITAADTTGKVIHTLPAVEKTEGGGVWVPKQIVSANERIFILEEAAAGQRVRALELRDPAPAVPTEGEEAPKERPGKTEVVLFEKELLNSQTTEAAAPLLRFSDGTPFVASPELLISLVRNPLIKKAAPSVRVKVAVTEKGAEITTTDGLPLVQVSETPHLKWAVFGRPEKEQKIVTIFESDGAAVEEFRASNLSQMMAFDAGSFSLKAPVTPTPTPAAAEATPATP